MVEEVVIMVRFRSVPWLTEPAIEFLEKYLAGECDGKAQVLEFGCGASTVWLGKRAYRVVSIDHKEKWYRYIQCRVGENVDLRLEKLPHDGVCTKLKDEEFDLVLIDGRMRVGCARTAKRLVRAGGILMLDNAERGKYVGIYRLLDGWELKKGEQIKADTHGFYYRGWTTSWWRNKCNEKKRLNVSTH
jgi:hypothetical protein